MTNAFLVAGAATSLLALFAAGVYGYNGADAKHLREEPVPLLLPAALILWFASVILMGCAS